MVIISEGANLNAICFGLWSVVPTRARCKLVKERALPPLNLRWDRSSMKEATAHKRVEMFDLKCKCKCGATKMDLATKPKAKDVGKRRKKESPAAASSTGPGGAPSDASHPDAGPSPEEVLSVLGAYLAEPEAGIDGQASVTTSKLRAIACRCT